MKWITPHDDFPSFLSRENFMAILQMIADGELPETIDAQLANDAVLMLLVIQIIERQIKIAKGVEFDFFPDMQHLLSLDRVRQELAGAVFCQGKATIETLTFAFCKLLGAAIMRHYLCLSASAKAVAAN